MRTQIAIVGGGPSGMLLAHLLHAAGIDTVVIEQRTRSYVLDRVRAGVLEHGSVELLRSVGVGDRMDREGFVHDGTELSNNGRGFRVDFKATAGRSVMVYGQTEVQKDLYDVGDTKGLLVYDDCADVTVHDPTSNMPAVSFTKNGQAHRVNADFIAGCDGFHGICRTVFPPSMVTEFERVYPFGWLGILSETPPVSHELIYARHPDGFALCSMRNPMLSRYYIQCTSDTKAGDWSDQQFWDALRQRLPAEAAESMVIGPSIEKSVTPLRSYVREPLRYGNLFLAGDSAHIVPPTGAKGLNLAFSDIFYLSRALVEHYDERSNAGLDHYSATALKRVWKAVRFSWWMTTMLHTFPDQTDFDHRMQETELDYLATSPAAKAAMAEQYCGIPY